MSQENVEVVRRSYRAFNKDGLAGASEFWDPEIVWHTDRMVPEPGVYTGFETVRTYLEGFTRAIGAWHIDTHELIDLGGEKVLSVLTVGGRPLGQTDKETQFLDWAWIVSVREVKITHVRSFFDRDRAFEAAGLSESGMSQENMEVIRRLWSAAERGDDRAVYALYDPDIIWTSRTVGPLEGAGGTVHGHDGVRKFFRDWLEAFETYKAKADTFIETGDEVIVGYHVTGRGKTSGLNVEMSRWNVYEIRNGLVTRVDILDSKAAALELVGLSEQDAHAES